MRKLLLDNVYMDLNDSGHFSVEKYNIYPAGLSSIKSKFYRNHSQNAYVKFEGVQKNSIIFAGGIMGDKRRPRKRRPRKRKLIEDILVVGSILTGWNWGLYYRRRGYSSYPVTSCAYLEMIRIEGKSAIEKKFQQALNQISNPAWQKQYENGFHLRMLLNHANILNFESRFLSMIVIWEWLYPHLKNPSGATPDDESEDLKKIINFILKYFYQDQCFTGNNIFHALRNQLAHSGKLPIDRKKSYTDAWMKKLNWESTSDRLGIKAYLQFFDKLTQVIVLRTLGIRAESIIVGHQLKNFLATGQINTR